MRTIILNSLQTSASIIKILILSKLTGILKIKNKIRKKKCIILGNGPSLNQSLSIYKSTFDDYDLICVNNFASSPFYEEIKPAYYILAAHIFFYEEHKLSQKYINSRNEIFHHIETKTTWDLTIMFPFMAKKSSFLSSFLMKNKNITPVFFNTTPIEGIPFVNHLFFRKGFGSPRPHNVLIPAIMNSIYLGYSEIYIVGADHSWLPEISVNEQNEALVHQKHFYDENESKPDKMEDYINRPRRLHEIIHKFYLSFKGYWEIQKYATSKNIKIYNASELSMIDAFERKKLS